MADRILCRVFFQWLAMMLLVLLGSGVVLLLDLLR
jgi:hypothetical protein